MRLFKFSRCVLVIKIFKVLAPVPLLLLLMLLSSCAGEEKQDLFLAEHPEAVFNRSLSDQEIALPFDGFHRDFLGERTVKLDQSAPREKPEIEWSRRLKYFFFLPLIVDSDGGTWFIGSPSNQEIYESDEDYAKYQSSNPQPVRTLVRLNPDNTISWKQGIYRALQDCVPVIVCQGAVIRFVKTYNVPYDTETAMNVPDYFRGLFDEMRHYKPLHDVSLECIDNDGNTAWRTPLVKVGFEHYIGNMVWRISDNRIMVATGKFHAGTFNVYSISNGELLETVNFPEWNSGVNDIKPLEPIEIPKKGWIGYQKDGIVLFNLNLRQVWKHKIAIEEITSQPVILHNSLVISTKDYLAALNLNTGKIIWKRGEYANAELYGAEPENDIIMFTISSSEDNSSQFHAVDHNGNLIFTRAYKKTKITRYERLNHTIIYDDGSVLFNDKESLNLFDRNGELLWSMNLADFGLSAESHSIMDTLSYAQDGRIVLCISYDDMGDKDYLFSLKTKS